ncbi:hypothetical protein IFM89_030886 [Coptis chinensis]|uniref:Uncharacterized protein n=1 Tax=Coptis chinensis TaxID=261450 RepID=A0A835LXR2_9MAGN|nr:hypothetical protein IFM89_030886 [Coptis chinensis]
MFDFLGCDCYIAFSLFQQTDIKNLLKAALVMCPHKYCRCFLQERTVTFSQASTPTNIASTGKQDGVRMPKELFVPWTLYFLKRDVDSSSKRSTISSKESVGPKAVHDDPTEEQQINSEVDSGLIDPAFLDALSEELLAEVLPLNMVKAALQHAQVECVNSFSGQVYHKCYMSYAYYPNGISRNTSSGESQVFRGSCTILSDDVGWGLRRLSSTVMGMNHDSRKL